MEWRRSHRLFDSAASSGATKKERESDAKN
jgi:hypothetical protein